mgnify:CR=1 FL=1
MIKKDIGETSDGYHTFNELYEHRHCLFITLLRSNPEISWRAKKHRDGTMYENWFVAGMHLPTGDISYHLPIKMWEMLDRIGIETRILAPRWDGHDSHQVLIRLKGWKPKERTGDVK